MLPPRKVKYQAERKQNENIAFRTFLKVNAEEKDLDARFLRLHQELFANYDCSKCRNCSKEFYGVIPKEDMEKDAKYLGMSETQFVETFLKPQLAEEGYQTIHKPCDFFDEKMGECRLGDNRPENCKRYPYTDQPARLHSLNSVLEAVEVCPEAFEIFDRLKREYGFR